MKSKAVIIGAGALGLGFLADAWPVTTTCAW